MLELGLQGIKDASTRDNFYSIQEEFRLLDVLNAKFKHYEITFSGTLTNFKYAHGLGFRPKDIIITSTIGLGTSGAGVAQFNMDLCDSTNFDISTTDSCTIRFFAGTFVQGSRA